MLEMRSWGGREYKTKENAKRKQKQKTTKKRKMENAVQKVKEERKNVLK